MKGFMRVTQEKDLYLIELLLKDTGGQACKRRPKNMLKSVISVRDSRQTFTSLEEFSTSFQPLAICSVGFGYCGSFP